MIPISRILIADDHPLFREALRHVVAELCPDAVCVEASDYDELLAHTGQDERFDVIFVDLMMPGGDALSELSMLRKRVPLTPVIAVSALGDWSTIRRVIAHGVAGYIPKTASKANIEAAIRRVLAGDVYIPDDAPVGEIDSISTNAIKALTPRQYAVLEQLARGSSNRQIAVDLKIEEITVKTHVSAILRKLDAKNRLQAVVLSRVLLNQMRELGH